MAAALSGHAVWESMAVQSHGHATRRQMVSCTNAVCHPIDNLLDGMDTPKPVGRQSRLSVFGRGWRENRRAGFSGRSGGIAARATLWRHLFPVCFAVWLFVPTPAKAADPENCLLCHQFYGLSRYDAANDQTHLFFIDPDYLHELRGPHARLACTACHPREEVAVIPHGEVSRVNCTQTCHLREPGGLERRFSHANVAEMLDRSAHPLSSLAELRFVGGPLLRPGQSRCLYCHDEPVFRNLEGVLPSLALLGARAFDRCDVCHAQQVPVDVAYYVRHVAARLQPARPPLEQAQVCAVCHADAEVLKTHEMKDAVASFVRSFHGKAALLGDLSTAGCLSCHVRGGENVHLMLGRTDPRSSVNPANVANSCRSAQCHPNAQPRLAAASVHLDLPSARASLEFWIAAAFILLTIGTFGPSLVICLLELGQIVVGREHEHAPGVESLVQRILVHPQGRRSLTRFTVNQRVQHWILVVLFTTLAATGFPMKFADRDWARSVIETLGGLHVARNVHHWAGIALVVGFTVHMIYCLTRLSRRARQSAPGGARMGIWEAFWNLPMMIRPSELWKGYHLLRYLVGLRRDPPTFGRFSIKEKFEYIGVFWGTTLLGITGAMLWGEQYLSQHITGRILNIALIAHTYEAFLAVIHVGILHIVNVVLSPHVFPLSRATITGETPLRELAEQHSEFVQKAARDLGVEVPTYIGMSEGHG